MVVDMSFSACERSDGGLFATTLLQLQCYNYNITAILMRKMTVLIDSKPRCFYNIIYKSFVNTQSEKLFHAGATAKSIPGA